MEQKPVEELLDRGLAQAKAEQWTAAADLFRRAVAIDRGSAEACFRLGWALWNQARLQQPTLTDLGVGYLAQITGVESVARERARKFSAHKRLLNESAYWLRQATELQPEEAQAYYYLAHCLRALGYRADAAAMASRAAELEPGNGRYASLLREYQSASGAPARVATQGGPPSLVATKRHSWDDVILDPRTKRELRQIQLMLEKPDLARELGVEPPTGILLKGAPGTGKTTVARVLAAEARCRFYSITPADINQMFVGESEKRVRDLFEAARQNAPSIIFIDEIDALLPARQGGVAVHYDKVVNQFLQEMDGMTPNLRVLVVGATNRVDMLDPAVRRGGRLSREIEIPLPDAAMRRALLDLFTRGVRLGDDVDLDAIAQASEGWSGADLRALVNEAGLQALIRIADGAEAEEARVVTGVDFEGALQNLSVRD
jgi:transitional endoplasmic reticulum ATPase